jgi:hypothetical protein
MTTPVPADFPRERPIAALTGVQPKLAVQFDTANQTYTADVPTEELQARYAMCEDLAQQVAQKCRKYRGTKYARMSETEILESFLNKLCSTAWGSNSEMKWVIRRTATLLGWAPPPASRT